jgi:DNA polymerase III epsilon subunit-like protein
MQKFLFFDTETNDLSNQFAMSFGGFLTDDQGTILDQEYQLIKPMTDYIVNPMAARKNGLSRELCAEQGVEFQQILDIFNAWVSVSNIVVAHNLDFDFETMSNSTWAIGAEIKRPKYAYCTMKCGANDITRIMKKFGSKYKWPSLKELYMHLFGEDFSGAHNARTDAEACMRCYFRARNVGYIA